MADSPNNNIGAALFGATRQAVLCLLYGHPEQRFYQRQIIRLVGLRNIGDLARGSSPENAYDRSRERGVWTDIPDAGVITSARPARVQQLDLRLDV